MARKPGDKVLSDLDRPLQMTAHVLGAAVGHGMVGHAVPSGDQVTLRLDGRGVGLGQLLRHRQRLGDVRAGRGDIRRGQRQVTEPPARGEPLTVPDVVAGVSLGQRVGDRRRLLGQLLHQFDLAAWPEHVGQGAHDIEEILPQSQVVLIELDRATTQHQHLIKHLPRPAEVPYRVMNGGQGGQAYAEVPLGRDIVGIGVGEPAPDVQRPLHQFARLIHGCVVESQAGQLLVAERKVAVERRVARVVVGWAALDVKAQRLLDEAPGFVFQPVGEVRTVQNLTYLAWRFGPEGAAPAAGGADISIVEEGRIRHLYTMLDPMPAPE